MGEIVVNIFDIPCETEPLGQRIENQNRKGVHI